MKTWIDLTDSHLGNHYESQELQWYILEQVQLMSYENASVNVSKRMGNSSLSDMRLHGIVQEFSEQIKQNQQQHISSHKDLPNPIIEPVDVYSTAEEILFLSDGVCVCEQKQKRDKVKKEGKERVTTDIMMLQQPDHSFKTFIACSGISNEELMASELKMGYQHMKKPLPVVCISDGARSIKNQCRAVFGQHITHILDYYHLRAKVVQLMSQTVRRSDRSQQKNQRADDYPSDGVVVEWETHFGCDSSQIFST